MDERYDTVFLKTMKGLPWAVKGELQTSLQSIQGAPTSNSPSKESTSKEAPQTPKERTSSPLTTPPEASQDTLVTSDSSSAHVRPLENPDTGLSCDAVLEAKLVFLRKIGNC
jgi:hypothetical protein